jgi:predicted transcriptional regulator
MKIEVTHEDGSTIDVTESVKAAYDVLWECTTWGQEVGPDDAVKLAQLAEACHYDSAVTAREVAQELVDARAKADAEYEKWLRDNGHGRALWAS